MVSTAGYEAAQKIGAINTRMLTRLTELQVDIAKFGVKTSLAQTKLLSSPDNFSDMFSPESNLANQFFEEFVKMSEQTTDVLLESGDELFTVFEGMLTTGIATPVSKTVAPATAKTATKPEKKASPKRVVKSRTVAKKSTTKKAPVKKKRK